LGQQYNLPWKEAFDYLERDGGQWESMWLYRKGEWNEKNLEKLPFMSRVLKHYLPSKLLLLVLNGQDSIVVPNMLDYGILESECESPQNISVTKNK
jgi:hypothetical protein